MGKLVYLHIFLAGKNDNDYGDLNLKIYLLIILMYLDIYIEGKFYEIKKIYIKKL